MNHCQSKKHCMSNYKCKIGTRGYHIFNFIEQPMYATFIIQGDVKTDLRADAFAALADATTVNLASTRGLDIVACTNACGLCAMQVLLLNIVLAVNIAS